MTRASLAGLACLMLAGCAIERVEHADHVAAGAVLDVTLHLDGGGEHVGAATVCAGLPAGWTVQSASYSGTLSGLDSLAGTATAVPGAESYFGATPGVTWSCWARSETAAWSDASAGTVDLEIAVPADASGSHSLAWTLGTSGYLGELVSARATSVVTVDGPSHPLGTGATASVGVPSAAVASTGQALVAVGPTGVWTSDNGDQWDRLGDGIAGAIGLSAMDDTLWAWTESALWTAPLGGAWSPVVGVPSGRIDAAWATPDGALVVTDGVEGLALGAWDGAQWQGRTVPSGAVAGHLVGSGTTLAWLTWDAEARAAGVATSTDLGLSWTALPEPVSPERTGQHDRVGVSSDGELLWVRARSGAAGAAVDLLREDMGSWHLIGTWPIGDLVAPGTPVSANGRWLVPGPWGRLFAVEADSDIADLGLWRSVEDGSAHLVADQAVFVDSGRVVGVMEWAPPPVVPDLSFADGRRGEAYEVVLPPGAGEWSVAGLPAGLSCDNGRIAGIPSAAGAYSVTVDIRDAWDRHDSASFPLTIHQALQDERPDDTGLADTGAPSDTGVFDTGAADTSNTVPGSGGSCSAVASPAAWGLLMLFPLMVRRRR